MKEIYFKYCTVENAGCHGNGERRTVPNSISWLTTRVQVASNSYYSVSTRGCWNPLGHQPSPRPDNRLECVQDNPRSSWQQSRIDCRFTINQPHTAVKKSSNIKKEKPLNLFSSHWDVSVVILLLGTPAIIRWIQWKRIECLWHRTIHPSCIRKRDAGGSWTK